MPHFTIYPANLWCDTLGGTGACRAAWVCEERDSGAGPGSGDGRAHSRRATGYHDHVGPPDHGHGQVFADRHRFASWTGTAPLDASSGEQNRHRLSRAGNRRMNHMIHIAAISQIRLDTDGRAYYRRKRAEGK